MNLISPAFMNNRSIPSKYTCEGDRFLSLPLKFEDVPEGAKSLALIVEDPDVPKEIREDRLFVHWILFNIPPDVKKIDEGETLGITGANTAGGIRYTGPCPPSEYEPSEHRYIFTLYALDTLLDLKEGATKEEVSEKMNGHILEQTELLGRYKKSSISG